MEEPKVSDPFTPQTLYEYIRDIVIIFLAILFFTTLIGLVIGWRSLYQFAEGLVWGAAIVMLLGAAGPMGFWRQTRSLPYQYASTRTDEELFERIRRQHKEGEKSYAFMYIFFFAGLIALGLSILIHTLIN
ncbi:MAG: hypothetical protein ACRDFQ_04505 [Anaerolineales bacterium]